MTTAALHRWLSTHRFLLVFGLLAALMGTSVGVAKITTTFFAIALGADASELGLLAAGQMAGTLVMSIPIGFLVDHFGPRRLFVLGSSLAGLTYVLIPAAGSPAVLLGATTAISFFMPLRFVALNTVFFAQIRQLGHGKAGWYRATHLSGQFLIGPAVAVALIALLDYTFTWWVLAASFAVTIAVSPLVLRDYAPKPAARPARPDGLRALAQEFAVLAPHRELQAICLVDVCVQALIAYQTTFIVAIALQDFHMDAAGASAFVTGTGVAFIATLMLMGGPIARFGARNSNLVGFGLVALALLVQAGASGLAGLWPGVVLLGIGIGVAQTVVLARGAEIGARLGQGKVSGLMLMTSPAGAILGGLVGGWAGEKVGLQAVYYLFLPVFLGLLAWQWRSRAAA